jgi:hypothetical protein
LLVFLSVGGRGTDMFVTASRCFTAADKERKPISSNVR